MADEVIISERGHQVFTSGGVIMPIMPERITTQVRDLGEKSAAFNENTRMIRITANGAALWYKIGDTNVTCTANTDGNEFLASGQSIDEPVSPGQFIKTAADV